MSLRLQKIKTKAVDRTDEIKAKFYEFISKHSNTESSTENNIQNSKTDSKKSKEINETVESKLETIVKEIKILHSEVDKYKEPSIGPQFRALEQSCIKLQLRLDNLQLSPDDTLKIQRKEALRNIELILEKLNNKVK